MKIKDLVFKKHSEMMSGTQAVVNFSNGYGASVITGSWARTLDNAPYEIAVMTDDGYVCYSTPITGDTVGYLNEKEADEILKQIRELPKREVSK